jgi:translation elongation factor EF-4
MEIITPKDFVGTIMELAQARRGEFIDMTYLTETRTTLVYDLPLAEVGALAYKHPLQTLPGPCLLRRCPH